MFPGSSAGHVARRRRRRRPRIFRPDIAPQTSCRPILERRTIALPLEDRRSPSSSDIACITVLDFVALGSTGPHPSFAHVDLAAPRGDASTSQTSMRRSYEPPRPRPNLIPFDHGMTAIRRELGKAWSMLRGDKPSRREHLEEVSVRGLRGIGELRVPLPFPVTVLAGPNGCGKSTVLFALACAYRQKGKAARSFTPARLFPDFRPRSSGNDEGLRPEDPRGEAELVFSYVADAERIQMRWSRSSDRWNRSYFGRKRGTQPERGAYLRTLANLSNPSEVRSVLQLAQQKFELRSIDASSIAFAQRVLSFRYSRLSVVTKGLKSVLFAERSGEAADAGSRYSEFHMSAGERSLLRLSIDISKRENALVLIDEVEAGLHPYVQQLLMLELQRLALRNKLQIVVTSHSPVVLDTVPPEARVFLERNAESAVVRREAYRDIIQKALYGNSQDRLSFLCEDEESEAFLRGVIDARGPKLDLLQNDVEVGRDTGKDAYPGHLETLARFRKLGEVAFVLDGDGEEVKRKLQYLSEQKAQPANILLLPGNGPPEAFAWERLVATPERFAPFFGLTTDGLRSKLRDIGNLFEAAVDKPSNVVKEKIRVLCIDNSKDPPEFLRHLGKLETESGEGPTYDLANAIEDLVRRWRSDAG